MKKLMAILTASAMLLALASCGEETPAETSSAAAPTTAPIVTPTVTPTTAPVISIDPVSSEPETPTAQNVALSGKAEDNGCALYAEAMSADLLIDGDTATEAWQPKNWNEGDYVIITFAEAAKIDCVVIVGESGTFKALAEGGYKLYTKNGSKWKEVKDAESDYVEGTDTVTFAEAIETEGIKVELLDSNYYEDGKIKYAPKLYEIEVYEAIEETPAEESVEETAE